MGVSALMANASQTVPARELRDDRALQGPGIEPEPRTGVEVTEARNTGVARTQKGAL